MSANGPIVATAPIIVRSDDGLAIFSSEDAARIGMEPLNVEDGVYGPAFDAEGRPVEIGLKPPPPKRKSPWWKPVLWRSVDVTVRVASSEPRPAALRGLLAEVLGLASHEAEAMTMGELIDLAVARFGPVQ